MTNSKQQPTICFYGAGSMAEAIISGILAQGIFTPEQVFAINKSNEQRLQELHHNYQIHVTNHEERKQAFLTNADIIVLAMKPKDAVASLKALRPFLRADQLLVSVIAGLSIDAIKQLVHIEQPVIRAMPNTSSSIGQGVTGISYSSEVTNTAREFIHSIFSAIGYAITIEEQQQAAITAVSGSGPAYVYYFVEAMTAAAEKLGFAPEAASTLVLHTLQGAAAMLAQTKLPAEQLRHNVTSPNGTTAAALDILQQQQFDLLITKAMERAAARANELGQAMEGSIHQ